MRLLVFDCAGDQRTVALIDGNVVVASSTETGFARHAEALVPLIDGVRIRAGWRYADIDVLAVGHGPGSFTGIRVAVAAGRALALALDRPVLALDGRDVLLRRPSPPGTTTVAAIDARRGGLYVAWAGVETGTSDVPLPPVELARRLSGRLVARGSGAALFAAAAVGRTQVEAGDPAPEELAQATLAALARGASPMPGSDLHPRYLRAADATPRTC